MRLEDDNAVTLLQKSNIFSNPGANSRNLFMTFPPVCSPFLAYAAYVPVPKKSLRQARGRRLLVALYTAGPSYAGGAQGHLSAKDSSQPSAGPYGNSNGKHADRGEL